MRPSLSLLTIILVVLVPTSIPTLLIHCSSIAPSLKL
ncbi:Uncharacterised protein [Mycobacterium tuberculosis]|nr:Uncharacterised protein [Mycobacterium tuberculosis]